MILCVYDETKSGPQLACTVFSRYLTLFMNLLNDCSEEEQDKAMDPNRKRSTSNLSALRNCTVQAMSNLLNANIDSGLMHSIGKNL